MKKYKIYQKYTKGTRCSVASCNELADYEVTLYDKKPKINIEFHEQDKSCPFLCEKHKDEDERGIYRHSNKCLMSASTHYFNLASKYPALYAK